MEKYFKLIEEKIKNAGYTGPAQGEQIYDEICDNLDGKEPGTYLFLSKKTDDVFFEYKIDVFEDQFNLSYIDIHQPCGVIHVDFDEVEK